jgi:cell division protein FtsB
MSATAETIVIARTPVDTPTRNPSSRAKKPAPREAVPRGASRRRPPQPQPQGRPRRARTGVFVAFVLTILTLGLLGMLMVNTALATGAFTLSELQTKAVQLKESEQALSEQLARAESPVLLEEAARALGMVPQDVPVFLRLEDGAILGNPIPQPVPIAPIVPESEVAGGQEAVTEPPVTTDPATEIDLGDVEPPVDSSPVTVETGQ